MPVSLRTGHTDVSKNPVPFCAPCHMSHSLQLSSRMCIHRRASTARRGSKQGIVCAARAGVAGHAPERMRGRPPGRRGGGLQLLQLRARAHDARQLRCCVARRGWRRPWGRPLTRRCGIRCAALAWACAPAGERARRAPVALSPLGVAQRLPGRPRARGFAAAGRTVRALAVRARALEGGAARRARGGGGGARAGRCALCGRRSA